MKHQLTIGLVLALTAIMVIGGMLWELTRMIGEVKMTTVNWVVVGGLVGVLVGMILGAVAVVISYLIHFSK